MTDDSLRTFDSNYKVDPPLRSQEHVEACLQGLKDGTLDVISSGHAPRASEKKMLELDQAPFGMVGLETLLGLVITKLIKPGHLDWMQALGEADHQPGPRAGHRQGNAGRRGGSRHHHHRPGRTWTVDPKQFRSRSVNTPFGGWTLQGRAVQVLVNGEPRL